MFSFIQQNILLNTAWNNNNYNNHRR